MQGVTLSLDWLGPRKVHVTHAALGRLWSGVSYTAVSAIVRPFVSLLCLRVGTGLDWVITRPQHEPLLLDLEL